MLGFLRTLARKLKSTWAPFTSDGVSRERVDCDWVDCDWVDCDQVAHYCEANGENPQDPPSDGCWHIYALRDWWQCGEHWEDILESDDKLPRGFSFKTRAEAEAYRLARPWIHDAYIEDLLSGAVVAPLRSRGHIKVHWAPGKEPTSWPPTPDDYEAARRYAMRDWPPHAGSPYEWVEQTETEEQHAH
jgi:hypothetical protein